MQRKLVVVMVGIALVAITLVGAGVLVLTQVGARSTATRTVEEQLVALQDIAGRTDGGAIETLEPAVRRLGSAFGDGQLAVVVIDDRGSIRPLPTRRGTPAQLVVGAASVLFDEQQLTALRSGDTVVVDQPRHVIGMVRLDISVPTDRLGGIPVLWVRQGVGTVSTQATRWFVLSATIVLLASAIAATWLARRFTAPVRAIERATAAIASGRLDTRIEQTGDDELGQLANSVNAMAADLERSRAAEQQFLMSITHDLRTPLTSIAGYAEALRDGAVDDPSRAGSIIGANADRLNRLVGDLLTLARLETKAFTFHLEPVDLAAIVDEQAADAHPRLATMGLSIVVTRPPGRLARVVADPDRLRQVIDNLVANAVKFATTTITLEVSASAQGATLAVVDDGPGIPAEDLDYVFERLYVTQLRPVRAESSSGLGLAIVRELVDGMGGHVLAERAPGGGTKIIVTLPT